MPDLSQRQRRSIQRLVDLIDQIDWDNDFPECLLPLGMCVEDVRFHIGMPRDPKKVVHRGFTTEDLARLIVEMRKENTN